MKLIQAEAQTICFAPIDLKLADFYIYDGFRVTGVTNTDTEPADETTIALTDCDESVPVGCVVQFANDSTSTEYVVSSVTTTGGTNAVFQIDLDSASGGTFALTYGTQTTNAIAYDATNALITTELEALDGIGNGDVLVEAGGAGYDIKITFQDDLAATVISDTTFTFDGSLLTGTSAGEEMVLTTPGVVDGTTTSMVLSAGLAEEVAAGGAVTFLGRRLEIRIGEGNVTYNMIKNREYIKNRGVLDGVRDSDEEPMEVSFEFMWEFLSAVTGSGVPTVEEVLTHTGEASDWETTDTDGCNPQDCVDLVIWYDPNCGGNNTEKITLPHFRYESLNHNLRDSQVSCSGKCNTTSPTYERGV